MKGFVRILEAILASLLILAAMAYFFEPVVRYSDWHDSLIRVEIEDALIALHKSGKLDDYVNYFNLAEFNTDKEDFTNRLVEMLPKTVGFSVKVNGRPNPEIFIGCDCTPVEEQNLKDILNSDSQFMYKGRYIRIGVENTTIKRINDMRPKPSILYMPRYKNLNDPQYRHHIDEFLEGGGTIFLHVDILQSNFADGFLDELFGLEWKAGMPSGASGFYDVDNINRTSYRIANYFADVSGLDRNEIFDLNANRINVDSRTIIGTDGFSYVKVNQLGRGRTVWFAKNDTSAAKIGYLTKAVVMWASGESYSMDTYTKILPQYYKSVQYIAADEEPYEINLIFWRVFY